MNHLFSYRCFYQIEDILFTYSLKVVIINEYGFCQMIFHVFDITINVHKWLHKYYFQDKIANDILPVLLMTIL
jgi:hypothetical protein